MNNVSYAEEKETKYMGNSKNNFDPLNYATAKDSEDGDISDKLEVISSNVNPNKEGTYTVRYAVTNSNNLKNEKDIKVNVVDLNKKQSENDKDQDKNTVNNTDKDKSNTEGNKGKDQDKNIVNNTDKDKSNTEGNKGKDQDKNTATNTDKDKSNTEGNKGNSNTFNPKTGDKGIFASYVAFGTSAILLILRFRKKIFISKESKSK